MHPEVNDKFTRSAEARVDHTQEKDLDWYFRWFGVDAKVELGREFMAQNDTLLQGVEARYGIHPELVCAVLGMETNFAQERQKGTYYVFNSLVSQYVFMERRRNFALRELKSLYEFSRKSGRETYHFIGSLRGPAAGGSSFRRRCCRSLWMQTATTWTSISTRWKTTCTA
jgi:membrane-bound lytic murein transglycosylase B